MAMRTNCDCTIYNRYIDPTTRLDKYQRANIASVAWENRKAANVRSSGGQMAADQARVFIPFARGANFTKPTAWQALVTKTGKWTLQPGDLIVKTAVTDDISANFTVTQLKAKYDDVLVISSVDTMDAGSVSMQHWNVGAA
jgi:hypothetical protein